MDSSRSFGTGEGGLQVSRALQQALARAAARE
jgi:hypothetical protein